MLNGLGVKRVRNEAGLRIEKPMGTGPQFMHMKRGIL